MFQNLPRQTFGRVQSKLFPIYFGLSAACSAVQLGVLLFGAAAAPQKQLVLLGEAGRGGGRVGVGVHPAWGRGAADGRYVACE